MARKHGDDQDDLHRHCGPWHRPERYRRDDDLQFICGPDAQESRIWRVLDLVVTGTSRPTEAEITPDTYEGDVPVSRWLDVNVLSQDGLVARKTLVPGLRAAHGEQSNPQFAWQVALFPFARFRTSSH